MKKSILSLAFIACLAGTITSCGPEHQHQFSDAFEKNDTHHWHKCINEGCEDITTEKVAHEWDENAHLHIDSTCLVKGYDLDVCKDCGYQKKVELALLDHNFVAVKGDECYKKCSLCGTETEHKTHEYGDPVVTEPTYERDGSSEKTCNNCGKTYVETIEKLTHHYSDAFEKNDTHHWHKCTDEGYDNLTTEKVEHTWDATRHQHVDSTCLAKGYDLDVCKVCGYEKRVELDLLEHNFVHVQGDDCYERCSLCGTETEHKAHEYGEPIVVEPTYEQDGSSQKTCNNCGKTVIETIEKLVHHYSDAFESDDDYHWTPCTDAGYEDLYINKEAHNYQIDTNETIASTCTSEGTTKYVCSICNHTKYITTDMVEHQLTDYYSTETGHYLKCANCDYHVNEMEEHDFEIDDTRSEAPTCDANGKTVRYCTICNYEEENIIPMSEHHYVDDLENYIEPTCQNDGQSAQKCVICGDVILTPIEKIDHHYVVKSDETNHWEECDMCGIKKEISGHNFSHTEYESTCTTQGYSLDVCTDCNYTIKTMFDLKEHSFTSYKYDEESHWQECSECKTEENRGPHTWDSSKHEHVDATCTTAGYNKDVCSICGYTCISELRALGHTGEINKNEQGHWTVCSVCGYTSEVENHSGVMKKDYNQHWTECSICGMIIGSKENHKLVSTSDPNGKRCSVCGLLVRI